MTRRLTVLVAFVLMLSACSGDDLDSFLDLFPSEDLSQSDDPGERAAGESATEILTIQAAQENAERGVAEQDLEAVRQAQRLRPDDPKYDAYEAAILAGVDLGEDQAAGDAYQRAMLGVGAGYAAANPDVEQEEAGLRAIELYMNALRDVIYASPPGEENNRRIDAYCLYLTEWYPDRFTERFPQDVSLYLALDADFNICP